MNDRFNTIAGWALGGGIVLLGGMLVAGEMFSSHSDTKGYPIEGVESEGGGEEAEAPIAALLQTADAGRGAQVFKQCASCHTINQGGANGLGPNLWANMGQPLAHVSGFAYSEALKSKGGNWDFEAMNQWLRSPRRFVPGTKMAFAGISNPQQRADLILYMNQQGSNLPLPAAPAAAPAEGAPAGGNNAAAPATGQGPTPGTGPADGTAPANTARPEAGANPNQPARGGGEAKEGSR